MVAAAKGSAAALTGWEMAAAATARAARAAATVTPLLLAARGVAAAPRGCRLRSSACRAQDTAACLHLENRSIGVVTSRWQYAGSWSAHAAGCELGASEGEDGEGDGGGCEAGGGCIGGVDAALAPL